MASKTTHIRVEKTTLKEMKILFPNSTTSDAIKASLAMYQGVQKAGRILYGNVWNRPKKK